MISMALLVSCDLNPGKIRNMNRQMDAEARTCTSAQMILVKNYVEACDHAGYFESYCFDRAIISYCDSTNAVGNK